MKLRIKDIHAPGDISRERIILEAVEDGKIGEHVIFRTKKGVQPGTVQGGVVDDCYWIPDREVKAGDVVVVYTKRGASASKKNPSGSTSHFFYWFKELPIWSDDRVAVLVQIFGKWDYLEVASDEVTEDPSVAPTGSQRRA